MSKSDKWKSGVLKSCVAVMAMAAGLSFAQTPLERGKYLVEGVAACGNCHSQRDAKGQVIAARGLSGGMVFDAPVFKAVAPNITPDPETGIGKWTDAQLDKAIREGIRPDGSVIGPPMPIPFLRGVSDQDLAAMDRQIRDAEGQRAQAHLSERLATTIVARADGVVTTNEAGDQALVAAGQKLMVIEQGGPRLDALLYVPARIYLGPNHWFEFGPFSVQESRFLLYAAYFFLGAGIGHGVGGIGRGLLAAGGRLRRHRTVLDQRAGCVLIGKILAGIGDIGDAGELARGALDLGDLADGKTRCEGSTTLAAEGHQRIAHRAARHHLAMQARHLTVAQQHFGWRAATQG